MDRFQILKGISPPVYPEKRDDCPKCVIKDDFVAIIVPSHKATKETADILYSQVPKPYAVFVSDTLDLLELIRLAENSQIKGTYLMARQPLRIQDDHRWSPIEMDKLQALNFNFLKWSPIEGFFQIWSDNIIGSQWGSPENPVKVHRLSMHRVLKFIDGGKNLQEKYIRARHCFDYRLLSELGGDPFREFSIGFFNQIVLTFKNNDSLLIG